MFVDETKVQLKAGDGGNGSASFRREKFLPKGGPDGGDGGRGGDVVLECNNNTGDLVDYYYKPIWQAKDGQPGRGRHKYGKNGKSVILKVPPGTVVFSLETGEMVTELLEHGQEVVLLKGGKGGFGNLHFKSSTNRAPTQFLPGKPGEQGDFRLVLKTIADIGLVGFPNAGKSTLTGVITRANPKTAAYPFTTLRPKVGMIEYPQHYDRLTMADIPGLIEGAHENRGLGHRFLRHIERCGILLIIVDMSAIDGRDPSDDYLQLLNELKMYNEALVQKPILVAANKMDEPEAAEHLKAFRKKNPAVQVIPISCLSDEGLPELMEILYREVKAAQLEVAEEGEAEE